MRLTNNVASPLKPNILAMLANKPLLSWFSSPVSGSSFALCSVFSPCVTSFLSGVVSVVLVVIVFGVSVDSEAEP